MLNRLAMPKPASWAVMALVALVFVALQLAFVRLVFPSGALGAVRRATGGLVAPTLVANLAIGAATIGILAVFGKQRLRDLGLGGRIGPAIAFTAAIWIGVNLLEALAAMKAGNLRFDPAWSARPLGVVGQWLGTTLGTALLEEVLFRGLLMRQIALRLGRIGAGRSVSLILAIILSQAAFAAMHLPVLPGLDASALTGLFVAGVALALLYCVTGNLLICIGLHGLADAPSLLVADRWDLLDSQNFIVASCLLVGAVAIAQGKRGRF